MRVLFTPIYSKFLSKSSASFCGKKRCQVTLNLSPEASSKNFSVANLSRETPCLSSQSTFPVVLYKSNPPSGLKKPVLLLLRTCSLSYIRHLLRMFTVVSWHLAFFACEMLNFICTYFNFPIKWSSRAAAPQNVLSRQKQPYNQNHRIFFFVDGLITF